MPHNSLIYACFSPLPQTKYTHVFYSQSLNLERIQWFIGQNLRISTFGSWLLPHDFIYRAFYLAKLFFAHMGIAQGDADVVMAEQFLYKFLPKVGCVTKEIEQTVLFPCCIRDGSRPTAYAVQTGYANHLKVLWSKVMVLNVQAKGVRKGVR